MSKPGNILDPTLECRVALHGLQVVVKVAFSLAAHLLLVLLLPGACRRCRGFPDFTILDPFSEFTAMLGIGRVLLHMIMHCRLHERIIFM